MRIALLGKGKTGSKVLEVLGHHQEASNLEVEVFDRSSPPTLEALKKVDVVISFLPGEAFLHYLDLLIEAGPLVVSGSTGAALPENLDQRLKAAKLSWVQANNFSLGMAIVRLMIEAMALAPKLLPEVKFHLNEIHHTKKLDAPSGTALSFKQWAGAPMEISSERTGDVIGIHTLSFETLSEKVTLEHEALDRRLFAEGAVWTAFTLYQRSEDQRPTGLIDFHQLIRQFFQLNTKDQV